MILRNNLKQVRKNAKLTQLEVAKKANVTTRVYQYYEAGQRTPNVYTAQLIAQALDTKVEEIFPLPQWQLTGEGEPDGNQAQNK